MEQFDHRLHANMAPLSESLTNSLQHQGLSNKLSSYLSYIGLGASSEEASSKDTSPLDIHELKSRSINLTPRDDTKYNPGHGTIEGTSIPNTFVFVLLGLIGASFVVTGVWFFFRARNGGFHWRQNDWDDYKSTVLRRKGPNGTTLSGATESTDLGGGSVYKDYDGNDAKSSLGSELSYLKRKIKGKKREKFTGDKRSKSGKEKRSKLRGGDADHSVDLEANTAYEPSYEPSNMGGTVDEDMRAYRHEKPARVGGLNKAPDSSQWDGSTAPSDVHSDLLSNREPTPTKKASKKQEYTGGIRKVNTTSTFWGGQKSKRKIKDNDDVKSKRQESQRTIPEMSEASASTNGNSQYIQEEARRLQELGRAAKNGRVRRDFSFQYGDDVSHVSASETDPSISASRREARRKERREGHSSRSPDKRKSQSPSKKIPGSVYEYGSIMSDEEHDGDLGTKVYHHPIPGLSDILSVSGGGSEVSAAGSDYAGERRKRRAEGRSGASSGTLGGYRRP